MKFAFAVYCLFVCYCVSGQKTELYFDHLWKSCDPSAARFIGILESTDSGWFRQDYFASSRKIQMQALFEDKDCKIHNGDAIYFHANGQLSEMSRWIHGKREGPCVEYYSNGAMSDSATYRNGIPVGNHYRWHRNSYLADSISHANDTLDVKVSWFDDGTLAAAGFLLRDSLFGKWKYYRHNGEISAVVVYDNGKVLSKVFFNEDGSPVNEKDNPDKDAQFEGGSNKWMKYLEKNAYWPPGLEFNEDVSAAVVVDFDIDEEGKIVRVEVVTPLHPKFDQIATNVILNSPKWRPAVRYNRKVKSSYRQSVTFVQLE